MIKNLKQYLIQYLTELDLPKMSMDEREMMSEEITRMVAILEEHPNISYTDLWDELHG